MKRTRTYTLCYGALITYALSEQFVKMHKKYVSLTS